MILGLLPWIGGGGGRTERYNETKSRYVGPGLKTMDLRTGSLGEPDGKSPNLVRYRAIVAGHFDGREAAGSPCRPAVPGDL